MNVGYDFDDMIREQGDAAVRQALDSSSWPWPEEPAAYEASARAAVAATPFTWRAPYTIPRRQFLYGYELRRRQLSAVVAPGAAGKTTLKVGRALCMVTGRDLLGHRVWNGPHRVWLWNLEDEIEEIEKTVHAFMKLWDLTPHDLGDRLYIDGVDSLASPRLKLAVADRIGGVTLQRPVSEELISELTARRIDYLDVDPFVSSHSVDENDNGAIDAVSKEWVRIAQEANCAVGLAHHVRKSQGVEASAFDARGAVSMINAARSVLVFQKMSRETAQEFGIAECDRKGFFSVYDDKNNKAPPAARSEWYEFVSVGLGNGDATGPEDSIGAVQRWEAPNTFGGVSARQLLSIQRLIDASPDKARKHSEARLWVGKLIAHVLDRNLDNPGEKQAIKKMILTWCGNGALRSVERSDDHGETREYVEVGAWAITD